MSFAVLLLASAVACVSAKFTVPVPVHYEIEKQFQTQTGAGAKMRWDPTNYLTYLAAVYSQCKELYENNAFRAGKVVNNTAYNVLQTYFDPSLLQGNLQIYTWEVLSDASQDAGTVDRDIRKLFGKSNGQGPLSNIQTLDTTGLRNYDRFGCSVETACKQTGGGASVMNLVCIFGMSTTPRLLSGTGGSQAQAQSQVQPAQPGRATARPRPTTVRARPARPAARQVEGGFYQSFGETTSAEFYESIVNDFPVPDVQNYMSADVVQDEQKVTAVGLCQFENNAAGYTAALFTQSFGSDAQPLLFGAAVDTMPTAQDVSSTPSDAVKNAFRVAIAQRLGGAELTDAVGSVACSWAACSQKLMVGCVTWGKATDQAAEQE